MVPTFPELFAAHIGKLYFGVSTAVVCGSVGKKEENMKFGQSILDLLPVLERHSEGNDKVTFYSMLKAIVHDFGALIREKDIPIILNCLKIGINETDATARRAAYNACMSLSSEFQMKMIQHKYSADALTNLLVIVQNVCEDNRNRKLGWQDVAQMKIFDKLRYFCGQLNRGKGIVTYAPILMERLLNALSAQNENYLSEEIIETIGVVFAMIAEKLRKPFYAELTEKLQTYLLNVFTDEIDQTLAVGLAAAIGKDTFMEFFIGIALSLLDAQDKSALTTNLYALFGGTLRLESTGFLPKIVMQMVWTVQMSEANAKAFCAEKEQAINSLKSLATTTGTAFAPHISACFNAVYDQLMHSEEVIRDASIEALAQFDVLFFQLGGIGQSQEIAEKIIPKFAHILKTDSASTIAIDIFKAYRKLLCESAIVFNAKMRLFNEVFNCIDCVMAATLVCQANVDFLENMKLIHAANSVFLELANVMQPFEFAVYFNAILPVLRYQLEKASQKTSENSKSFRMLIYSTLNYSVQALKAYGSGSFDVLLSLFLCGMEDDCKEIRCNALLGLGELLHTRTSPKRKATEVAQKLLKCLVNEKCVKVVEAACNAVCRLIMTGNGLISLQTFLPRIVEVLKKGQIRSGRKDMFICFQMLLKQHNKVLLTILHSVVLAGLLEFERKDGCSDIREYLIEFVLMPLLHPLRFSFGAN